MVGSTAQECSQGRDLNAEIQRCLRIAIPSSHCSVDRSLAVYSASWLLMLDLPRLLETNDIAFLHKPLGALLFEY
jgi:hypothetical protein